MGLLVFRTDIKSKKKVKSLKLLFNRNVEILRWNVDLEDIDNVLRIEATEYISERDVMEMVSLKGFYIQPLPD
ncbi:hypothetical protein POV27_13120 [Aureisphaera galaxeae]|uniref:hypothetical protein n=1 Tax=Aureisphaera galaxeae TaxID=1538023 RepID=UPI002350AF10|nr:hypothetical protein [Aureisphaera galaxeae]MDC8004997.1 hypothetical protein [Aureisphaera galaxeae]